MGKALVLGRPVDEVIKEIGEAFPVWFEKLNLIVGLTSLTFAVLAYKSARPELFGWLLLIVIMGVVYSIRHYFPKLHRELRKKKNKSELEVVVLKSLEARYLSMSRTFIDGPIYWVGIGALFAVANGFKVFATQKLLPLLGM
ncbi:hypothetical protein [Alloalcanivorax xenomutans]|uniref:hypothetical protein n=1 Tax=Alloalcanivorax xenomutans TaxID=1094342 RepID=UPI001177B666|nr:hypothetical protein [Alloalcanivorax xenomutans]